MKIIIYLSFLFIPGMVMVSDLKDEKKLRTELIEELVKEEYGFAKANCFCRIGDNRGSRLKEYPNPIKDLGILKSFGGPFGGSNKKEAECGDLCSKKAYQWYKSQTTDNLCKYLKKAGQTRITAYSKVGGRKWVTRGDYGVANCCNTSDITCPQGSWPEKNFPGMCASYVCDVRGDQRLYNKDKTPWGFIWQGKLHKLTRGKVNYTGWRECK